MNNAAVTGKGPAVALATRIKDDWKKQYDYALKQIYPWAPDMVLLKDDSVYGEALREAGGTNCQWDVDLKEICKEFFENHTATTAPGYFNDIAGKEFVSAPERFKDKLQQMFDLCDREHASILVNAVDQLRVPPSLDGSALPALLSYELPINVSITPVWIDPDAASQTGIPVSPKTVKPQQATLDKVQITLEAIPASSATVPPASATTQVESAQPNMILPDFEPNQKVTLNISTMLNSPSALDYIEYVSTYIYVYPWQHVPSGDVVLEREFWEDFFSINLSRENPLLRKKHVTDDMRRAIEDMRIRIRDTATTAYFSPVDLGTQQHETTDSATAGIGGTSISGVPPKTTTINPTLSASATTKATATFADKQQLDQRTTYIDEHGDFLRITQRGMPNANLAGRYKEEITLHVPAAASTSRALAVKRGGLGSGGNSSETKYAIVGLSQPLYSRVDAITFSVAAIREPTALRHSADDSYGVLDKRDAAIVICVTVPQHMTLWQWDRQQIAVDTWDVFGKSAEPPHPLYFRLTSSEAPTPLILAGFTKTEAVEFCTKVASGLNASDAGQLYSLPPLSIGRYEAFVSANPSGPRNPPAVQKANP
jgi:hypothetical protein